MGDNTQEGLSMRTEIEVLVAALAVFWTFTILALCRMAAINDEYDRQRVAARDRGRS